MLLGTVPNDEVENEVMLHTANAKVLRRRKPTFRADADPEKSRATDRSACSVYLPERTREPAETFL